MCARGLGQGVSVALLGRDGDDLAAILEHGPLAAGRDPEVSHMLCAAGIAGPGLGQVGGHADLEPARLHDWSGQTGESSRLARR